MGFFKAIRDCTLIHEFQRSAVLFMTYENPAQGEAPDFEVGHCEFKIRSLSKPRQWRREGGRGASGTIRPGDH